MQEKSSEIVQRTEENISDLQRNVSVLQGDIYHLQGNVTDLKSCNHTYEDSKLNLLEDVSQRHGSCNDGQKNTVISWCSIKLYPQLKLYHIVIKHCFFHSKNS